MFGKKKKFRGRVVQIITQELGIDDNNSTNKFFPGAFAFLDEIDAGYKAGHNAETVAIAFTMSYWGGLVGHGPLEDREQAKILKPRIIKLVDAFATAGMINAEVRNIVHRQINDCTKEWSL